MGFLNTGYSWIPFMVQLAQWGIPLKVRDRDDKVLPTAACFLSAGIICLVPHIQAALRRRKKQMGREVWKEGGKAGPELLCFFALMLLLQDGWICDNHDGWILLLFHKKHPSECPLQDFRDQVIPQQYQGQIFMLWPWIWLFLLPPK